jgi:hypothetical protein
VRRGAPAVSRGDRIHEKKAESIMKTVFLMLFTASMLLGDEIVFKDGTSYRDCLVRDEGRIMRLWSSPGDFPEQSRVYPRDEVERFTIQRGPAWDEHEAIQDLSVTHITLDPPLVGFHGVYHYDETGAPSLTVKGVEGLKLAYEQGENLVLTAQVKNTGFAAAATFDYRWEMNGETVGEGRYEGALGEMEAVPFQLEIAWPGGDPRVRFEVVPGTDEIARFNNAREEVLSAWGFDFVVSHRRVDYMHAHRNTLGSFSWEDYYQWHLDLMNRLFADSVHPGQPNGIEARVRLNRIVYVDEVDGVSLKGDDGLIRNQGAWFFRDSEKEKQGAWWRPGGSFNGCTTEWSLPHELGHQLGLVDLYNWDYHGTGGFPYSHFFRHPRAMMHWHGPHVFHEVHAAYLNRTKGRPRGAYGEFLFEVPRRCFLQVLDVNARPVAGAEVRLFQRGARALPGAPHVEESGVEWWDVEETGNFESRFFPDQPVIRGTTDARGFLELPNRPVRAVETFNGYARKPNPFGNINVVGQRGLMLALVTKADWTDPFFLELVDFNLACARGRGEEFVYTLKGDFPSVDSPPEPACTRLEYVDNGKWWLRWTGPAAGKDTTNRSVHRYRIYRRLASEGLNFEPWDPCATVEADLLGINLPGFPANPAHAVGGRRYAYGISSVNERGVESGIVERFAPDLERVTGLIRTVPYGEFHLCLEGDAGLVRLGPAGRYFDATPAHGDHYAVNRQGRIVSTAWDRHCVNLFTDEMEPSGTLGDPFKPGLFLHPSACALDDAGNVAVADGENHRVLIFDGKSLWEAEQGSRELVQVIKEPFDCRLTALAYNHGLCVVYDERGRLYGFEDSGKLLFQMELGGHADLAVEGEDRFLLLDRDRGRLFRYLRDGTLLRETRCLGGEELKRPRGLALLEDGRVATFQDLNRILIGRFPSEKEEPLPGLDGLYANPVRYESPEFVLKVLVINYEPLVPGTDGKEVRLSKRFNWNDPHALADAYARELRFMSGGFLRPEIVERIDVDGWPVKIDGFVYNDDTYMEAVTTRNYHEPDYIDYVKLSEVHDLAGRVARGEIDEVWLFGAPGFGYYESRMYGPGAYWCNSTGIDMPEALRLFVVMGFNYERGLAEMIHDLGHRTESAMSRVYEKEYGRWQATQLRSDWERFACSDHYVPGWGAVGDCHFPCNGQKHYDYANPRKVSSSAEDWLDYPALTGKRSMVNCETWADENGNYHLGYMRWLFSHLPRAPGINGEGKLCNWWSYVFDMSTWPSSRGR